MLYYFLINAQSDALKENKFIVEFKEYLNFNLLGVTHNTNNIVVTGINDLNLFFQNFEILCINYTFNYTCPRYPNTFTIGLIMEM